MRNINFISFSRFMGILVVVGVDVILYLGFGQLKSNSNTELGWNLALLGLAPVLEHHLLNLALSQSF